jgi:glycosyltransferase involved in cell wall biosynthesis
VKIIYLHQYFRKPDEWGSTRSYYLAKALTEAGHEVILLTAYSGAKKAEAYQGFTIYYLPVDYKQEFSFGKRVWAFLKFAMAAYKAAKSIIDSDNSPTLLYASSTPLTVGLVALALKFGTGTPYLFEVRDLWPEVPVAMGAIRSAILKGLLFKGAKKIYAGAEAIISLSPGITKGILKYKPVRTIYELSNFSDTEHFFPTELLEGDRRKYLEEGEKGVIYSGAIGKANHLEYLVEIARESEKVQLPLRFFIVGDGSEKERIEKMARGYSITNITFLPFLPKTEMPRLLNIMDFSYISYLNVVELGTGSPNKLFDSLASAKVCIVNSEGWMRAMVESEECGFYVDPSKPEEFLEKIAPFLDDEGLLKKYKQNARHVAERSYSRELICGKLLGIVNEIERKFANGLNAKS